MAQFVSLTTSQTVGECTTELTKTLYGHRTKVLFRTCFFITCDFTKENSVDYVYGIGFDIIGHIFKHNNFDSRMAFLL